MGESESQGIVILWWEYKVIFGFKGKISRSLLVYVLLRTF